MKKYFKTAVIALLVILILQPVAFAAEELKRPPKPTEGIESSDPNHGSSNELNIQMPLRGNSLFYSFYCTIDNKETYLYCEGYTGAYQIADKIGIDLYLQKWNGSKWVDIRSWNHTKYDVQDIEEGEMYTSYQHGSYYRVRSEHYIKIGSKSETQNTTSSYIYVP